MASTHLRHADGDRDHWLLIVKPGMTGNEPLDVAEYQRLNPAFPQQPTTDQFFDEARFESYRTLGYHSVLALSRGLRNLKNVAALCEEARDALATAAPVQPA